MVKYLAALHTCDSASFEAVWHPEGQLLGLNADGGLLVLDADEYKEAVAGRAPSMSEAYTQVRLRARARVRGQSEPQP